MIIGIVMGFLLVSLVYASSSITSLSVIYSGPDRVDTVQFAIDDLNEKINNNRPSSCLDGYYCVQYKTTLELGDYVYYKPEKTSYLIDKSITGYTGSVSQVIYPSELNLWRVLNINDDGTVDLISEYVSSTKVYFRGQIGYLNLVGYLNELAKQYETEGITDETNGSRYFGYNGQTEYLDPNKVVFTSSPWTCSTGGSCNPIESQGGGDTLYEADYNQVKNILGIATAYQVGTNIATGYWMASRRYSYSSSTTYVWLGRNVDYSGAASGNTLYNYSGSNFNSHSFMYALRPIVTLKSGLLYGEGVGIKSSPMKIITS